MSGARLKLDPVAAAEAGIAGSKHLMASVADDLSQHQRWLANYRAAERRRARRLQFQEFMIRLELRRRRLMRALRRFALASLRVARAVAGFLARTSAALFVILRRAAGTCALWLRPRAEAIARILRRWLAAFWAWAVAMSSIGFAWLVVQICMFALVLQSEAVRFASWSRKQARAGSRVLRREAVRFGSWSRKQAHVGALVLRREASRFWSWSSERGPALALYLTRTAASGASWIAQEVRRMILPAEAFAPQGLLPLTHRALAIRPESCTALICIDPPKTTDAAQPSGRKEAKPVASRQPKKRKPRKKKKTPARRR